ncbi:ATP-binding protein [Limosilactobacillus difficilis]|uniref:ATP-binding protein n=1 Tax=Limosilactobacillus difficilis TaxID=2991838 RepID=UPI0024BB0EF7|nr:ATP-binding protein [Limosilactobacillus difficilis]
MALTYQQLLIAVPAVIRAGNVPNIVGEAGIGKSALVQEVADRLDASLYTTVVSLVEKGDLAVPVPPLTSDSFVQTKHYGRLANVQYGYSETLVAIIRAAEQHPGRPIIWFLDEFNRGTQAVQSELMNLVLQRQVNALHLPDEVRIVIAENPDSSMEEFADSNYAVTAGDAAIRDRTVRLVMRASVSDWLRWAGEEVNGQARIHRLVRQYLQDHPDTLAPDEHGDDLYPTPRAWERVSRNLVELLRLPPQQQQDLMADVFSGDLGTATGAAFAQFLSEHGQQIAVADLVQGTNRERFADNDELGRLTALKEWVQQNSHPGWAIASHAANFLAAAQQLSPDGQYSLAEDIGNSPEPILEELYQKLDTDSQAANLYHWLARVATQSDKGSN